MANKKISELTAYTSPLAADLFPIVDIAGNETKKITWQNLQNSILSIPRFLFATDFATAGRRQTDNVGDGTVTQEVFGAILNTSATVSSAAQAYTRIRYPESVSDGETGSPMVSISCGVDTLGTDFKIFVGLGIIGSSGSTINLNQNHIGFKITRASSGVVNVYATQGGGSETASASLTTISSGTNFEFIFKVNGSSSIDYYWRKDGGSLSSATNLTTNMPSNLSPTIQAIVSNVDVASSTVLNLYSASYER